MGCLSSSEMFPGLAISHGCQFTPAPDLCRAQRGFQFPDYTGAFKPQESNLPHNRDSSSPCLNSLVSPGLGDNGWAPLMLGLCCGGRGWVMYSFVSELKLSTMDHSRQDVMYCRLSSECGKVRSGERCGKQKRGTWKFLPVQV